MATFNTPIYTSQIGTPGASLNVGIGLAKNVWGKLRVAPVLYTLLGTEASADKVNLYQLKNGSRLIAALSRVVKQASGTTITTNVGDASNATRYASALALGGAAGVIEFASGPGTDLYSPTDVVVQVPPVSTTDQTSVVATLTTVSAPTAAAKLLFLLAILDE